MGLLTEIQVRSTGVALLGGERARTDNFGICVWVAVVTLSLVLCTVSEYQNDDVVSDSVKRLFVLGICARITVQSHANWPLLAHLVSSRPCSSGTRIRRQVCRHRYTPCEHQSPHDAPLKGSCQLYFW